MLTYGSKTMLSTSTQQVCFACFAEHTVVKLAPMKDKTNVSKGTKVCKLYSLMVI